MNLQKLSKDLALPLFIGKRLVFAKSKDRFVSFISRVSVIGLILGVVVLIVVLSVMNGFAREMREVILSSIPHASASSSVPIDNWQELQQALLETHPEVVAISPYNSLGGLLVSKNQVYAQIFGINPRYEQQISNLHQQITPKSAFYELEPGSFSVVIGRLLAYKLGLNIGDSVDLILSRVSFGLGGFLPEFKRLQVIGFIDTGSELDSSLALTNIEDAALLLGAEAGDVFHLRFGYQDVLQVPYLSHNLRLSLPTHIQVQDWTRQYGALFNSIKIEKRMVSLLLYLIVAVASFNILASLVMTVREKQKDIAVLMSMGAQKWQILTTFLFQGFIIALIGCALGSLIGVCFAYFVGDIVAGIERIFQFSFLSSETYFITYLPSEIQLEDVVFINLVAFLLCLGAAIYPALKAASISPAQVLKGE